MTRLIFPLVLGLGGIAILVWLGTWQLQRLDWKEGVLAGIEARMAADPIDLPAAPTEDADEYRRVSLTGTPTGAELHVLTSGTAAGTGYRVISAILTETGRAVMVDRGLLPIEAKDAPPATAATRIEGVLLWPDDRNSSTPDPDIAGNFWFARDLGPMAAALGTEPLLIVESTASAPDPRLAALPVTTAGIPNDHLNYAITWFLLALVWAGMTLYLVRRTLRKDP